MSAPTRVFLIDAHALCYRAFYAVKALRNSKGQPTNAVFGFYNILNKLILEAKPTHLAICFDTPHQTHRQKKFANYKIQRQAMPDDLSSQIKVIRRMIEAFGFPILEQEGYEADDVMAAVAHRLANKQVDVFIASDDKDMCQLLDEHIKIYSPRLQKVLEAEDVIEKFGAKPNQITDYIALAGDSSDNIPGVKGIGEVGACKLIGQFGSLEEIYEHIHEVAPIKLQEKLIAGREDAFVSKELAILDGKMPIEISLSQLLIPQPNREALCTLFEELEFKKLAQDFAPQGMPVQESLAVDLISSMKIIDENHDLWIVYDLKSLRKSKFDLKGKIFDVHLADYLLAGGQGQYHMPTARSSSEAFKELYHLQKRLLHEQGMDFLYQDVELPLSDILFEMEQTGVKIDLEVLKVLSKECDAKIAHTEKSLFEIAGAPFNVNSPKQLSEILFERLKLPAVKKIKTGFSTNEEVLTKLASLHPLPALVLEYRQIAKLKSTYIDALPLLADVQTHRIHATFDQTGAQTGRLSSNNPNLQNIPIRTDFGKLIRKAFLPLQEGHLLLSADYSQVELRILAHLAGDEDMKKAFEGEGDVHRYTASLMFDVPQDQVDEKMRYAAKRINFGIVYGMGAFSLSKDLDISSREAQEFIDKYFLRYPKVHGFLEGEIQKTRDLGYVSTMFHRRRYLPDIHNRNGALRQFAERQAINAPIQGTAADLIKIAMVNIYRKMQEHQLKSSMIMTVHDELVFDVPLNEIQSMVKLVRREMEEAMSLSVPLKASVKTGPNWLDMEKIKS